MPPDPTDTDFGATIRAYAPEQQVFSRFTLVRLLGRGGMGVVWLAQDRKLEREVALKFLPEAVALDPRSVDDLKRETRRSLDLTHPHIVRIHDFFEDQSAAAISMEYVDGGSLAKRAVQQPLRCFEPDEILPWLRQLVDALDYAHTKAKIVHRDLKPANLMIAASGDLKVTDFGISATVTDSLTRVSKLMSSGATPAYSSPQQVMGERASPFDDIYSLGATIYDLVTGKPPFHTGNLLIQVQTKAPESMAERRADMGVKGRKIPECWEKTVAACLAKDIESRPPNVRAILAGLEGREAIAVNGRGEHAEVRKPWWAPIHTWLEKGRKALGPVTPIRKDSALGFGVAWGMLRGVRSLKALGRWYHAMLAGLAGPAPRITVVLLPLVAVACIVWAVIPGRKPPPQEGEPEIVFNAPTYLAPEAAPGFVTPSATTPATTPGSGATPPAPGTTAPATSSTTATTPPVSTEDTARPKPPAGTTAAAGTGVVEILSDPPGAIVVAEGREIGRTPLALPGVKPGAVQFALRLKGFEDAVVNGKVTVNETTRLATQLRPARVQGQPPLTVQDLGINLLWMQPGEFVMGGVVSESDPDSDEQPPTSVQFTKGFWIAETEVTQRQWWLLMATNPSGNTESGERAPVERISWEQAQEFCAKLDQRERAAGRVPAGYAYQLPTEAQWEYACRGGTTGDFAADLAKIAVTGGRDSSTKSVASLQPNAWGLFDMHGNVSEWTRSWYGFYPGGTVVDYAGLETGAVRVFRGGAFDSSLHGLRSAHRNWVTGSIGASNRGFRIALTPQQ